MNNLILVLIFSFSVNTFAKSTNENLPQLVLTEKAGDYYAKFKLSKTANAEACLSMIDKFQIYKDNYYFNEMNNGFLYASVKFHDKDRYTYFQTTCSEVKIQVKIEDTGKLANGLYIKKLSADYYCKPRTFSESALMSLYLKCKSSPQQECFNPELIKEFDTIEPIEVKKTITGKCS